MELLSIVLSILMLVNVVYQPHESLRDGLQFGKFIFQGASLTLNRSRSYANCHSLQSVEGVGNVLFSKIVSGFVDSDNVKNGAAILKGSICSVTGTFNAIYRLILKILS
ncbi:hypothetical protein NTGBS_70037 [Candidatus Nitrotoga sp. BS]|nr:hypothetical protein NTGBS_70037 [Candidatus Nitrotoga sp. BS]